MGRCLAFLDPIKQSAILKGLGRINTRGTPTRFFIGVDRVTTREGILQLSCKTGFQVDS